MLKDLFLSFVQIGALTFGGGYASLPLIEAIILRDHQWLTMQEYTDLLTISQMTPGPIAINAASFVGAKVDGPAGAIVATVGFVLPSFIIILILAMLYYKYRQLPWLQAILKGLRPIVVGLIAAAAVRLMGGAFLQDNQLVWSQVALFFGALFVMRRFKLNPIVTLCLTGIVGMVIYV